MKKATACILATICVLVSAGQAICSARHFKATHEHFSLFSNQAAELYFKTEDQTERNILSHLTATSAIYADKALMVSYLVDILENIQDKADKAYVSKKIDELKSFLAAVMPEEIEFLSELVDSQSDGDVRSVGDRIINEMRVFERNIGNL